MQLVVAAALWLPLYLCGGLKLGCSDRVAGLPVVGSFVVGVAGGGGYFWLAVLGWCVAADGWFGRVAGTQTLGYLGVCFGVGTFAAECRWPAVNDWHDCMVAVCFLVAACCALGFIVPQSLSFTVMALAIARSHLDQVYQGALSTKVVVLSITVDLVIVVVSLLQIRSLLLWFVSSFPHLDGWLAAAGILRCGLQGREAAHRIAKTMGWGRRIAAGRGGGGGGGGGSEGATAPGAGGGGASASRPRYGVAG